MHRNLSVIVGATVVLACVNASAQQAVTARPGAPAIPRATGAPAPSTAVQPKLLPGTRPNVLTSIQGNALSSTNGGLPNAYVRLRDARIGRIVDTQISDKSGLFAFKAVDPGSYIVEIVDNQQSVLAASQLLNVNAGEAVSAVVKLPFRNSAARRIARQHHAVRGGRDHRRERRAGSRGHGDERCHALGSGPVKEQTFRGYEQDHTTVERQTRSAGQRDGPRARGPRHVRG